MLRCIPSLRCAAALGAALSASPGYADAPLVGYRSVLDLSLAPGGGLADSVEIGGRAVTEFSGSACAGYTTKLRFVTSTTNEDGERQTDDARVTMYETVDGYFEFNNETYTDDALIERSVGTARRSGSAVSVTLTEPGEKAFDLAAGVVFPTEQVARVIGAAMAGKKFLAFDLYDGSETGETVYGTATVIGQASTAGDDVGGETSIVEAGFAGLRHWPVTTGYFKEPSRADMTPAYTMSLVLYENGISRDIRLDYGDFALVGKLSQLEVLPSTPCPG